MNHARRDDEWLTANRPATPAPLDIVKNPAHYTAGRSIEPIDVIEDWALNYHLGNALKYISRAGRKDPSKTRQDISKAIWYMQRFCDQCVEPEQQAQDADELVASIRPVSGMVEMTFEQDLWGIPDSVMPGPDHDDVILFEEWDDDDPWRHIQQVRGSPLCDT